jgi:hypothetical protein
MTRIAVVALAATALASGVAPAAAADEGGRLVVKGRYVDTGGTYIEGARQYIVIKRRRSGEEVLRREYGDWLNKALPPGRYRLGSYTRACAAICPPRDPKPDREPCTAEACPTPGGLDRPSDRCARNFRLRRGQTLKARLRMGVGIPCRIRFSVHRVSIRGTTSSDETMAGELRRYFRRNAGSARWYHALRTIEADSGVFTMRTTLHRSRRGRAAADQICDLIQGSDLADFTPGHNVRGQEDRRIAVCPARRN